MICLNETKFVWFKQNIFGPNKYLFESNKVIQANYFFDSIKFFFSVCDMKQ